MKCPACGAWAVVKETRPNKESNTRRRRYECANEHRFTTIEQITQPKKLSERAYSGGAGIKLALHPNRPPPLSKDAAHKVDTTYNSN